MLYAWLADAVLVLHLGFIAFVVLGGLVVLRWPRLAWAHLPAAVWGALVELFGWTCPLTPLENRLRLGAGSEAYEGDFVERYLSPVVYPEALTREIQMGLGAFVVLVNVALYVRFFTRRSPAAEQCDAACASGASRARKGR